MRPRDDTHAKVLECGKHFALLLSIQKRMMILHRDEGREVMCDSIICNFAPSALLLKAPTSATHSA